LGKIFKFQKEKDLYETFINYLNTQYIIAVGNLEKEGLTDTINELESFELTYIADKYKYFELDFILLNKYSLIYQYERRKKEKEPNKLHKLLIRNVNELYKILLNKIFRLTHKSVDSTISVLDLLLGNKNLEFNKLAIENAQSLSLKIKQAINDYHNKLQGLIKLMEDNIKLKQEEFKLETIKDVKVLSQQLKNFEFYLENLILLMKKTFQ
jgi:hypothetical protein